MLCNSTWGRMGCKPRLSFKKQIGFQMLKIETLIFLQYRPLFKRLRNEASENIVEKGENAGYQHFLPSLQCFLFFLRQILVY